MKAVGVALVLVLTACTYDAAQYAHPGVEEAAFQREAAACEADAYGNQSSSGLLGLGGMVSMTESFNNVYDACMRSKGYARTP